jgi:hypothetical protein
MSALFVLDGKIATNLNPLAKIPLAISKKLLSPPNIFPPDACAINPIHLRTEPVDMTPLRAESLLTS